jgi:hypothetical protein
MMLTGLRWQGLFSNHRGFLLPVRLSCYLSRYICLSTWVSSIFRPHIVLYQHLHTLSSVETGVRRHEH